ncbi:hypothetical protein [Krasilnikoviella flava]|uniref:hypothetical protein n=1 Tax=Krasilnikoviella flava TaxID=526729 RepID=UPI0009A7C54B|nr:hypothetical protein [Krasilnikoviella flava]
MARHRLPRRLDLHEGQHRRHPRLRTAAALDVSGLPPAEDAPDWLTGGEFGTEASAPAVVVLLAMILIAFVAYRRWDKSRVNLSPGTPAEMGA